MKAEPDLLPLRERRKRRGGGARGAGAESARTYRVSFEKLGDARYLSHRNTMDVLERALRASGASRPLHGGLQPAPAPLDGPGAPARARVAARALRRGRPRRAHGRARRRRQRPPPPGPADHVVRRSSRRARGRSGAPRRRPSTASRSRTARRATSACPSWAQTATTPKKFLEKEYGVPPEGQHAVRVTRLETVLQS